MAGLIVSSPLTIGRLFDRAVTLLVQRRRTALVLVAVAGSAGVLAALFDVGTSPSGDMLILPLMDASRRLIYGLDPRRGLTAWSWTNFMLKPWLIQCAYWLILSYVSAALTLLIAGTADEVANLVRAVWSRRLTLFGAAVALGILAGLTRWICFAIPLTTAALLDSVGVKDAVLDLGIVYFVVSVLLVIVAPVLFALQMTFAVIVLEQVSLRAALVIAWRRARHVGARRMWLLSIAVEATFQAGLALVESILYWARQLHADWLWIVRPILQDATAFAIVTAVVTVAAIDYRVRMEGLDLEIANDGPLPA